ncbi:MAG: tetratricopeptide repeat protein [Burkholderiaceae bacterium]
MLASALQLQQAGRYEEADRLYQQVLAEDPRHFDALHMGGVVAYQRSDFERARQLIEAALAVQPQSVDAMMNMELVQRAFAAGSEFDRYALAHLPRYCALAEPDDESSRRLTAAGLHARMAAAVGAAPLHLLLPPAGLTAAAQRFVRALYAAASAAAAATAAAPATSVATATTTTTTTPAPADEPDAALVFWSTAAAEPVPGLPAPRVVPREGAAPGGGLMVIGTDVDAGDWMAASEWTARWLFCDLPAHGPLAERLRRLSAHGRHHVALMFASDALAQRLKLPGTVLVEAG